MPASWEVVRLGDVAEVQTGRAVNRKAIQNGSLKAPYLSVANVKDGYLDLDVVKTMLVAPAEISRYRLQNGDVLFTEGGDADKLGRGTVWRNETRPLSPPESYLCGSAFSGYSIPRVPCSLTPRAVGGNSTSLARQSKLRTWLL